MVVDILGVFLQMFNLLINCCCGGGLGHGCFLYIG